MAKEKQVLNLEARYVVILNIQKVGSVAVEWRAFGITKLKNTNVTPVFKQGQTVHRNEVIEK